MAGFLAVHKNLVLRLQQDPNRRSAGEQLQLGRPGLSHMRCAMCLGIAMNEGLGLPLRLPIFGGALAEERMFLCLRQYASNNIIVFVWQAMM